MTTTLVLAAVAGWSIAQGAFAVLLGEPYLGTSGWLWVAIGVVVGIPPAIMVGRRAREMRDPRTGQPMVRTPRWMPAVLLVVPLLIVGVGWVAIQLAN